MDTADTAGRADELRSIGAAWEDWLGGIAQPVNISGGDLLFGEEIRSQVALIRTGTVRVFIRTGPGRQVTIRYGRRGDLVGLATLLAGPLDWNAEAVVPSVIEVLTLDDVHNATEVHPELPWVIAAHVATLTLDAVRTLAIASRQPIATRVAYHLREIASQTDDGPLVALISHQRLADAVGTVREVVSRQLRTLRAEGVIATMPGRVVVLSEERLESLAAGR
jgi:CRP/FNR family transcriptional regulator, cyclic AMP receptor protein